MKPTIHDLKKILGEPDQPGKILVDYCKNCKYWGDELIMPDNVSEEAKQELQGKYRHCDHEESPVVASPKDYGCVFSISNYQ